MTETVKVVWDGQRKFGVATGPGEAQFFVPGMNEVPLEVWEKLTKDKGCSVHIHLKGGLLKLASQEVQEVADLQVISEMKADAAIEIIEEVMDEQQLGGFFAQEQARKKGPRKTVVDAINTRLELFKLLNGGEPDESAGAKDGAGEAETQD